MTQNLQSLALLLVFSLVGLASWFLALLRTRAVIAGMRLSVCGLVLIEEVLGLAMIYLLVSEKNIPGAVAYALGGAIGAYLAMRPTKKESA